MCTGLLPGLASPSLHGQGEIKLTATSATSATSANTTDQLLLSYHFPAECGMRYSFGAEDTFIGASHVHLHELSAHVRLRAGRDEKGRPSICLDIPHCVVHVCAYNFQLRTEPGTKIPDLTARMLEVDVCLRIHFPLVFEHGTSWTTAPGFDFKIESLRLHQSGLVAMPRSVLRLVLNLVLPSLLKKGMIRTIPPELGTLLAVSSTSIDLEFHLHCAGLSKAVLSTPLQSAGAAVHMPALPPPLPAFVHAKVARNDPDYADAVFGTSASWCGDAVHIPVTENNSRIVRPGQILRAAGPRATPARELTITTLCDAQHCASEAAAAAGVPHAVNEQSPTAGTGAWAPTPAEFAATAGMWLGLTPAQAQMLVRAQVWSPKGDSKKPALGDTLGDLVVFSARYQPAWLFDVKAVRPSNAEQWEQAWQRLVDTLDQLLYSFLQVRIMHVVSDCAAHPQQDPSRRMHQLQLESNELMFDARKLFERMAGLTTVPLAVHAEIPHLNVQLQAQPALDTARDVHVRQLRAARAAALGVGVEQLRSAKELLVAGQLPGSAEASLVSSPSAPAAIGRADVVVSTDGIQERINAATAPELMANEVARAQLRSADVSLDKVVKPIEEHSSTLSISASAAASLNTEQYPTPITAAAAAHAEPRASSGPAPAIVRHQSAPSPTSSVPGRLLARAELSQPETSEQSSSGGLLSMRSFRRLPNPGISRMLRRARTGCVTPEAASTPLAAAAPSAPERQGPGALADTPIEVDSPDVPGSNTSQRVHGSPEPAPSPAAAASAMRGPKGPSAQLGQQLMVHHSKAPAPGELATTTGEAGGGGLRGSNVLSLLEQEAAVLDDAASAAALVAALGTAIHTARAQVHVDMSDAPLEEPDEHGMASDAAPSEHPVAPSALDSQQRAAWMLDALPRAHVWYGHAHTAHPLAQQQAMLTSSDPRRAHSSPALHGLHWPNIRCKIQHATAQGHPGVQASIPVGHILASPVGAWTRLHAGSDAAAPVYLDVSYAAAGVSTVLTKTRTVMQQVAQGSTWAMSLAQTQETMAPADVEPPLDVVCRLRMQEVHTSLVLDVDQLVQSMGGAGQLQAMALAGALPTDMHVARVHLTGSGTRAPSSPSAAMRITRSAHHDEEQDEVPSHTLHKQPLTWAVPSHTPSDVNASNWACLSVGAAPCLRPVASLASASSTLYLTSALLHGTQADHAAGELPQDALALGDEASSESFAGSPTRARSQTDGARPSMTSPGASMCLSPRATMAEHASTPGSRVLQTLAAQYLRDGQATASTHVQVEVASAAALRTAAPGPAAAAGSAAAAKEGAAAHLPDLIIHVAAASDTARADATPAPKQPAVLLDLTLCLGAIGRDAREARRVLLAMKSPGGVPLPSAMARTKAPTMMQATYGP